ncbi:MAG: hypothetical protein AAF236_10365 [Verrucomicrobiota bacterium]
MRSQVLQANLNSLRKSGSVFGLVMARETTVMFSDVAFSAKAVTGIVQTVDDIIFYYAKEHRSPDTFAFGYDGGNLLLVTDEFFRLIVWYSDETGIDRVTRSARSFLKDYKASLITDQLEKGLSLVEAERVAFSEAELPDVLDGEDALARPVTERISARAKGPIDPTSPIAPVLPPGAKASQNNYPVPPSL